MNIQVTVRTLANKTQSIAVALRALAATRIMVGIPAESAARQPDPGQATTLTNAEIGYIQENGAPEAGIPPRPFLKPGVASVQTEIAAGLEKAGKFALEGRADAVDRQFHRVGALARDAVKMKIQTGPFLPLKPATLAARRRKGRMGTKPLLDSTQMRSAVNYVLRKK